MESNQHSERILSYSEARAEIEAIRAEIAAMGANDSEFSSLDQIVADLVADDITPQEAVTRARAVRDSKQADH